MVDRASSIFLTLEQKKSKPTKTQERKMDFCSAISTFLKNISVCVALVVYSKVFL